MNKVLILPVLFGLAAAVSAQDSIEWTDGTRTTKAKVLSFTVTELAYQDGGARQARSSDQVVKITLGDQKDTYKRGYADKSPGQFLNVARELVQSARAADKVMGQIGFAEASRLFYEYGEDANAVQTLAELIQAVPDTGFLPQWHRLKLDVYLGSGRANEAKSAADTYYQTSTTSGWPSGFTHQAEFYQIIAEKVAGTLDATGVQTRMRSLISKLDASNKALSNRCNVELAHSMREGGDVANATKIYEEIVARESVDDPTRAGGYLGLGHIAFAEGNASNREAYYNSMLLFLRVYVETKDAWGAQRAEALYHASQSAKNWGGERSQYMSQKLSWMLGQQFPDSEWAKK